VGYELSEGDRDFIARQLAASRRRKLQAFKASSVSATIAVFAAGIPGLAALWFIGNNTLAVGVAAPGMLAAVYVFRRMHPDFAR